MPLASAADLPIGPEHSRAARGDLIRKYGLIQNQKSHPSRAQRFADRMARGQDEAMDFAALARVPVWSVDPATNRDALGRLAVLLHYRPVLDRALDGSMLRALAEACGEELLDTALQAPSPSPEYCAEPNAKLPDASAFVCHGDELVGLASSKIVEKNINPLPTQDVALHLCNQAHGLMVVQINAGEAA